MSVRFVLDVRVKPGAETQLRHAYGELRRRVQGEPGLLGHQLCRSLDDPERWAVISEWTSVEASEAWDRSHDHARLIGPMRACFAQATATKLEVVDGAIA